MRRVVTAAVSLAILLTTFALPTTTQAQYAPTWVRTYDEIGRDGCLWYVSQWTDNSYQGVPWLCPPGAVPLRNDRYVPAVRSYTEIGREGCQWYVALWADGVYTGAPIICPFGIVPFKPGSLPPAAYGAPVVSPYWAYPYWRFW